jgi:phosphopantothenoylcysteine decarboxylase/phosphopantothenate--cysteine ligase
MGKQTILIGVSSGIAAFKAVSLVESLRKKGFNVIVIMTENAKKMISPSEFEKASGNKVTSELFPPSFDYKKVLKERKVEHISLAEMASVIAIVPATANIIAKVANGIADDLITTTILASHAALLFAPAMNVNMWENKVTLRNIESLKKMGAFIVEPEKGMLACGYEGKGRLADIKLIENEIIKLAEKRNSLSGKRIIVTAGGTEEEIDDVRVLTNKSSGKMGIRIAEECAKRGADVTLISGRCDVEPNCSVKNVKIKSADEMFSEIKRIIKENDVIIHAAAVSDFTVKKEKGKIKSGKEVVLKLIPNVKIIDEIKKINPKIKLIGFKAESNVSEKKLIENAYSLLKRSNADLVVANDIGKNKTFGSEHNEVLIVDENRKVKKIGGSKLEIAEGVVDFLVIKN